MTWRLPAEWEPQESLWLVWPRDPTTWPDGRIRGARAAFTEVIRHVTRHQRVDLVVHPDLEADARKALADATGPGGLRFHPTVHQDSWIRDYGPLTLVDDAGHRRSLKFRFDAWGGKYETLMADDAVVPRLVAAGAMPAVEEIGFVLEGGAVETDGQGTFLATRSVPAARGQTEAESEAVLRQHLGARKVLWLDGDLPGDDTDGHIDTLTRFIGPTTVVTTVEPDMDHPSHRDLLANRDLLRASTDALGRSLMVHELPLPDPMTTDDGDPLPGSYANFLITDGLVLMPSYGCVQDEVARQTLAVLMPERDVVPIDHRDLIWGFGGIHCLSMQVPSGA